MRVAFVSHSAQRGGAEQALLDLLGGAGDRVEAVLFLPRPGPLGDAARALGAAVEVVPFDWWVGREARWRRVPRIARNALAVRPLARRIAAHGPDLVYTNSLTVGVGAAAAERLGLPHVWHLHEFGREDHGLTFDLGERRSLRRVDRLSAAVIANSRAVADRFRGPVKPEKIRVVHYCLRPPPANVAPDASFWRHPGSWRCVIVGLLHEGKRQVDAVLAVHALQRAGRNVELAVVGGGHADYEAGLRRLVEEHGLHDRIHFLGHVAPPYGVVAGADVALVCSRSEAFGRVTVEAMLLGKPVVAARSGGTVELMRDREQGLFYPPGDVNALAAAIARLIEDPAEASRMGERGRQRALREFTGPRYAEQVLEVLRAVAADGGGRRL